MKIKVLWFIYCTMKKMESQALLPRLVLSYIIYPMISILCISSWDHVYYWHCQLTVYRYPQIDILIGTWSTSWSKLGKQTVAQQSAECRPTHMHRLVDCQPRLSVNQGVDKSVNVWPQVLHMIQQLYPIGLKFQLRTSTVSTICVLTRTL